MWGCHAHTMMGEVGGQMRSRPTTITFVCLLVRKTQTFSLQCTIHGYKETSVKSTRCARSVCGNSGTGCSAQHENKVEGQPCLGFSGRGSRNHGLRPKNHFMHLTQTQFRRTFMAAEKQIGEMPPLIGADQEGDSVGPHLKSPGPVNPAQTTSHR